jgi:hypothetical protein
MKPVVLEPLAQGVLRALYELAELDCPADAALLARALTHLTGSRPASISPRASDIARVLLVLDARGLVQADRVRLTMRGLAEAVRLAPLSLAELPWLAQRARRRLAYRVASAPRAAAGGGRN